MKETAERHLVSCHECNLLQYEPELEIGGVAKCCRCNALLYKETNRSIDFTLAYTVASAILYVIANSYPILDIELAGNHSSITLFGATQSIWEQGMPVIAASVNFTAIIVPAVELGMMLYLLLPLKFGIVPRALPAVMRLMQAIKPWGMLEVFMLGILVSLVKLTGNFKVIPGVALWSFAMLTFSLTGMSANFNPREIWLILQKHDHDKYHN